MHPAPNPVVNPAPAARPSFFRAALAVVLSLVISGTGIAAAASERILSFSSAITVDPDASMLVTETIKVVSSGDQIKRGIYRDFPTTYKDRAGNTYVVGFMIQAVARDGKPEAHHTEALSNGIRVYMGQKEVLLPPGEHTYTLSYRTDRQIGFFKDHDELYWNVTGNGWIFPIETAAATVLLPPGVPADGITLAGYTGPTGATGQNFTAALAPDGKAVFKTTRRLNANEGLTLVVSWPKGFVREPTPREKAVHFLKNNLTLLAAVIGFGVLLLYYLLAWFAAGRDPARGTIMPIYTPPDNLSPAAMRFMAEMGYDDKVFAAAVIDMAVKGFLSIHETDKTVTLTKIEGPSTLSAEEKKIAVQFFQSNSSIALERKNHARIAAAQNALRTSLTLTFEKTHFVTNRRAFITGVAISAAAVAASFLSALDHPDVLFLGVWLTIWSVGVTFLAVTVVKLWHQVFTGARKLGTRAGSLGAAVLHDRLRPALLRRGGVRLDHHRPEFAGPGRSHGPGGCHEHGLLSPAEGPDDARPPDSRPHRGLQDVPGRDRDGPPPAHGSCGAHTPPLREVPAVRACAGRRAGLDRAVYRRARHGHAAGRQRLPPRVVFGFQFRQRTGGQFRRRGGQLSERRHRRFHDHTGFSTRAGAAAARPAAGVGVGAAAAGSKRRWLRK